MLGAVEELAKGQRQGSEKDSFMRQNPPAFVHLKFAAFVVLWISQKDNDNKRCGVDMPAVHRFLGIGDGPVGRLKQKPLNLASSAFVSSRPHLKFKWPLCSRIGCGTSGMPAMRETCSANSGLKHRSSINLEQNALQMVESGAFRTGATSDAISFPPFLTRHAACGECEAKSWPGVPTA